MKHPLTLNNVIAILLSLSCAFAFGQTLYEHELNEEKLNELKQNIRHEEQKPERWTYQTEEEFQDAIEKYGVDDYKAQQPDDSPVETYESPEIRKEDSYRDNTSPNASSPLDLGPLGTTILFVLFSAALIALIYYLFINSNFKGNGAVYKSLNIEDTAPSDIPKTELEKQLEQALAAKNFRKAVRIYYLFILKDLSDKKWIQWEKQKTNMHYILELQSKSEAEPFSKVATYYEFIWYGKREISEQQFKAIEPSFLNLLNTLNTGP